MLTNNLQITTRTSPNNSAVIALEGVLDGYTYNKAEAAINQLFSQGCYDLLIDLSRLAYISCVGTGIFIGAWKEARENKGDITFANPNKNVNDIFTVLGLTGIFNISRNLAMVY